MSLGLVQMVVMLCLLFCSFVASEPQSVTFLGIARTLVGCQVQPELQDGLANLMNFFVAQGKGTTRVTFSTAREGYAELEIVVSL